MAVLRQFAVLGFGEPKVPFDDQERVPQGATASNGMPYQLRREFLWVKQPIDVYLHGLVDPHPLDEWVRQPYGLFNPSTNSPNGHFLVLPELPGNRQGMEVAKMHTYGWIITLFG